MRALLDALLQISRIRHKPVPFGDPENPLGTRWIAWRASDGTNSGLGFHGTKEPDSVGQDLSQGCVRMLNRDVEELYEILGRITAIGRDKSRRAQLRGCRSAEAAHHFLQELDRS